MLHIITALFFSYEGNVVPISYTDICCLMVIGFSLLCYHEIWDRLIGQVNGHLMKLKVTDTKLLHHLMYHFDI
jgi:hypothetical protein